jgi:twitching motility protein PilT
MNESPVDRSSLPSVYASEDYLVQLLAKAVAAKASDIHLKVGQPPGARIRGDIVYFRADPLTAADTQHLATHLVGERAAGRELDGLTEYDAAYSAKGVGRFRVNIFRQRGSFAIVMRTIPFVIPTFDELGTPPTLRELAEKERGLVLVVGAAGNGKSSTLAAMVGHLNDTQALHIVTVEDPIEFLHQDNKASVSQRGRTRT